MMFCSKCGNRLNQNDRFCRKCGNQVNFNNTINNPNFDERFIKTYIGKNSDGLDNYQMNEVTSDLLEFINSRTKLKTYNSVIYYGKYLKEKHNGLIKELYTKDNLKDIINNYSSDILIEYINESNLEFIKTNDLLSEFKNDKAIKPKNASSVVKLINYYSMDTYNQKKYYNFTSTTDFAMNALNVESAYVIEGPYSINEDYDKYYKFNPQKIDNMYYLNTKSNEYGTFTLTNTSIDDASAWVGSGACSNVKRIYNAYKIEGNYDLSKVYSALYIYVPLSQLRGYDLKNIKIASECGRNHRTEVVYEVGNYLVSSVNLNNCSNTSDLKFTLLYSTCN